MTYLYVYTFELTQALNRLYTMNNKKEDVSYPRSAPSTME